jgi:hypothetical protein
MVLESIFIYLQLFYTLFSIDKWFFLKTRTRVCSTVAGVGCVEDLHGCPAYCTASPKDDDKGKSLPNFAVDPSPGGG